MAEADALIRIWSERARNNLLCTHVWVGITPGGVLSVSLHHCHPLIPRGFKFCPIVLSDRIGGRQLEPLEVHELSPLLNAEVEMRPGCQASHRSEERRVGKECRSR